MSSRRPRKSFAVFAITAMCGALLVSAGHAWGPDVHQQAVRDALRLAPAELATAVTPFLSELPAAIMEPDQLWGRAHDARALLPSEFARAVKLFAGDNPYKRFKALMRVSHLAADVLLPCREERPPGNAPTFFERSLDNRLRIAIEKDDGFPVTISAWPVALDPTALPAVLSDCDIRHGERSYADLVRMTLSVWRAVVEGAGQRWPTLAASLEVRNGEAPLPPQATPRTAAELIADLGAYSRGMRADRDARGVAESTGVSAFGQDDGAGLQVADSDYLRRVGPWLQEAHQALEHVIAAANDLRDGQPLKDTPEGLRLVSKAGDALRDLAAKLSSTVPSSGFRDAHRYLTRAIDNYVELADYVLVVREAADPSRIERLLNESDVLLARARAAAPL
ncbi:MAG: hypothetical protein HYV63_32105 [Candidatus Schekmanbacteria bacterium]|nr:hypothetical protein [Candidatus Schekmanbacteria bacterium]